uniref:Uncharacterized protein n=1 Tax=Romanomermis culicivorax TaxID=13658 RepID=A0A915J8S5_ROMCU
MYFSIEKGFLKRLRFFDENGNTDCAPRATQTTSHLIFPPTYSQKGEKEANWPWGQNFTDQSKVRQTKTKNGETEIQQLGKQ